jgi:flagellar hook-length control protein FliK
MREALPLVAQAAPLRVEAPSLGRRAAARTEASPDEPHSGLRLKQEAADKLLAGAGAAAGWPANATTPTALAGATPETSAALTQATQAAQAGAALSSGLAAAGPGATAPAAAPTPEFGRIDWPIDQPGFGPALGAQVSWMVRDGLQQATLQLHPAEMGPILVQIAVDGSAARVNFQAEVAATRAAIEASLPALAGALQEAGLTLAGGGVAQAASANEAMASAGLGGQALGQPAGQNAGQNAGQSAGQSAGQRQADTPNGRDQSTPASGGVDEAGAATVARAGGAGARRGLVDLVA